MAEALVTLSLAANCLQVIDFGAKFFSTAWRIYSEEASILDEFAVLQASTSGLKDLMITFEAQAPDSDEGLKNIIGRCHTVINRFLKTFSSLDIKKDEASLGLEPASDFRKQKRGRHAFCQAFKAMWKKRDIEELQDAVSHIRELLVIHLLVAIRKYASASTEMQTAILQQFQTLQSSASSISIAINRTEAMGKSILTILHHAAGSISQGMMDEMESQLLHKIYSPHSQPGFSDQLSMAPGRRQHLEQSILTLFRYGAMSDREDRIVTTYDQTFRWIFEDPPSDTRPWSNFRKWLQSSNQLYWITGKPGSGKSTLMKFICSERCEGDKIQRVSHQYLREWSGQHSLIVVSFYFWNSGYSMQMTQQGLFRAILHQALSQKPSLIPRVCPRRWEALCLFDNVLELTEAELQEMLVELARTLAQDEYLCMFVDGLDEFNGNHQELLECFQKVLSFHKRVKLCASSRPWNVFEDYFKDKPSLKLEHLTHGDILHFATSKFNADQNFQALREYESQFADNLIENVVLKSKGVFLWVDLVVASLLAGMGHGDRVTDLQRRLDLLPPELEHLYEKILLSLDKFYLAHAAQYLTLVDTSAVPIPVLLMSFTDEDIPKFIVAQPVQPFKEDGIRRRNDIMRRRLASRCKGLLEIGRRDSNDTLDKVYQIPFQYLSRNGCTQSCACSLSTLSSGGRELCLSWDVLTVQYLHRTVRDYIQSIDAKRILGSPLPSSFDAELLLCAGNISLLKGASDLQLLTKFIPDCVERCLTAALKVKAENQEILFNLLDQLDKTGTQLAKRVSAFPHIPWTEPHLTKLKVPLSSGAWALKNPPTFDFILEPRSILEFRCIDYGGTFMSLMLKFHLVDYVVARVATGCLVQRYWPKFSFSSRSLDAKASPWSIWPLLLDAINSGPTCWNTGVVKKLLHHGANPNFMIPDDPNSIPWANAMKFLIHSTRITKETPNGWRWKYRERDLPIREVWLPLVKHGGCRLDDRLFKFLTTTSRNINQDNKLSMLKRQLGQPIPQTLVREDFIAVGVGIFSVVTENWNHWVFSNYMQPEELRNTSEIIGQHAR